MTIKIDNKIIGYEVAKETSEESAGNEVEQQNAEIIQMHEKVERPEHLIGATYKISTPMCDHALYVTINDILLNPGTEHELRRPFEVFINSKSMEHFQWIVALTRIMSAVFRKGGDVTFLVEELSAVFDPRGGYFKPGGTVNATENVGDIMANSAVGEQGPRGLKKLLTLASIDDQNTFAAAAACGLYNKALLIV